MLGKPVRKDTVYERFKKISGVCMYCGKRVDSHTRKCWKKNELLHPGTDTQNHERN